MPSSNLQEVLAHAWALLARGACAADSSLHTPVLATVGLDGEPDARTVLLHSADPDQRRLYFNTDRRSLKYAELGQTARAMLVFFDPRSETQLRVRADIQMHYHDDLSERLWRELPTSGRRLYATVAAPGTAAPVPTTGVPLGRDDEAGYENFVVLEATPTHLDWLHFAPAGHRRAAFRWTDNGCLEANWLYP
jgi:hypothetical protein